MIATFNSSKSLESDSNLIFKREEGLGRIMTRMLLFVTLRCVLPVQYYLRFSSPPYHLELSNQYRQVV